MEKIASRQRLDPSAHLRRFNTHLENRVLGRLTRAEADRAILAWESARATKIVPPGKQKKFLGKRFPRATIEAISNQALELIPTDHECRLGMKAVWVGAIREAMDSNFRKMQLDNPAQQAALDYWIKNFNSIPEDRSKLEEVLDFINSPFKEIGNCANLLIMNLGASLRRRAPGLGNELVNYPVRKQLAADIVDIYKQHLRDDVTRELRDGVANKYQVDVKEMKVLEHPDFGPRVRRSLLLGATPAYTSFRNIIGWGLYGTLLLTPQFREAVDHHPYVISAVTAASISLGALARVGIDYWVLKNRGWSSDPLETVPALITGNVNERKELEANPRWAIVGTPVDIAINFLPAYSWAFFINPPYSTYAFALTIACDQAVLAATNLAYTKFFKLK